MLFEFRALTPSGELVKGKREAENRSLLQESLLEEGLTLLQLKEKRARKRRMSREEILSFTRELSQLIRAGLPLYESLLLLEEKYKRSPLQGVVRGILDRLRAGVSFSEALTSFPACFDAIYLSLIRCGEESGALADALGELTRLLERSLKLKKRLTSAFTYPLFLFGFALLVVTILLFVVVPPLQELMEGRDLHAMTRLVFALSSFVRGHPLFILGSLGTLVLGGFLFWRRARGKLQGVMLKMPLIGPLLLKGATLRLTHALAMLLRGGVPLLEALQLGKRIVRLRQLEEFLEQCSLRVSQGELLSRELARSPLLPTLLLRMVALGEESGKLGSAFQKAAELLEEELERELAQLTTLLQPLLLLVLGGMVGVILLSVLLPLTDMKSLLSEVK